MSQPPDWESISFDVLCPLCEYNLRGLSEPRCPECGYPFHWSDLTDPDKKIHPYLFEHHPKRNFWSFRRTLVGGLRPSKFWLTLNPAQPSRPRRLALYWLITVAMLCIGFLTQWIQATIVFWMVWSRATPFVVPKQYDHYATMGFVDRLTTAAQFPIRYDQTLAALFFATLVYALWPWLTLLALSIFQISMYRAKIKTIHVLRSIIYSFDAGVWLGMIIAVCVLLIGWFEWNQTAELGYAAAYSIFALELWLIYRLWRAYRLYLHFKHALATIIVSQIIAFLTMCVIAVGVAHLFHE